MAAPIRIWLVTDTHWHHDQIVGYSERPVDHQEILMKNWRAVVKPQDVVIHLGDVSWDLSTLELELNSLPGRKILTLGNHDEKKAEWYMAHGFDLACESFILDYRGYELEFTHTPYFPLQSSTTLFNPKYRNIFGHWHNNDHRAAGIYLHKYHILLALEGTYIGNTQSDAVLLDYKPLALDKLLK